MAEMKILAKNKQARFNYIIQETYECGIVLIGTEVKSLREIRFSFSDSYCIIKNNELWLIGFHISQYPMGTHGNHDPDCNRKLLVHKQEIKKLRRKVDEKGMTLVPTMVYLKNGRVKMEIGVGLGKKMHDKRASIKERDMNIDAQRELRQY